MKKPIEMSRSMANTISAEVNDALKKIADAHGLMVVQLGGKFSTAAGTYNPKFEFRTTQQNAFAAEMLDLDPALIGRIFIHKSHQFKITGFERGRPKFCVRAERILDGRVMLFPRTIASRLI